MCGARTPQANPSFHARAHTHTPCYNQNLRTTQQMQGCGLPSHRMVWRGMVWRVVIVRGCMCSRGVRIVLACTKHPKHSISSQQIQPAFAPELSFSAPKRFHHSKNCQARPGCTARWFKVCGDYCLVLPITQATLATSKAARIVLWAGAILSMLQS